MVRSERTTAGFSHQLLGQRSESLQEPGAFVLSQRRERVSERLVALSQPRLDLRRALRVEMDDGPALVLDRLAAVDEVVLLQVAGDSAGGRQREAERGGELPDGVDALGPDVGEERDVPRAYARRSAEEAAELVGRTAPAPERAQHLAQEPAQLLDFGISARAHRLHSVNSYRVITIASG
jgi:hypothetical protein